MNYNDYYHHHARFRIDHRVNVVCTESGMDSLDKCLSRSLFTAYPHKVEYRYNSQGFRDQEWPLDGRELEQAIWCIGDSFTVGIGSPIQHTWPYILSQLTGRRTINVSMDGASNGWISEQAINVLQYYNPFNIVIMWSYLHRRQVMTTSEFGPVPEQRHYMPGVTAEQDQQYFEQCIHAVTHANPKNVVHSIIPQAAAPENQEQCWATIQSQPCHVPRYSQLDYARDGHHFDRVTAEVLAKQMAALIQ